mmetsp:Transcript_14064/g.33481  ORF Transcript_14064/g.33481 Transcript_14064/m.33481 type:complete len:257 (+) Transcript_14064:1611-2381(+)
MLRLRQINGRGPTELRRVQRGVVPFAGPGHGGLILQAKDNRSGDRACREFELREKDVRALDHIDVLTADGRPLLGSAKLKSSTCGHTDDHGDPEKDELDLVILVLSEDKSGEELFHSARLRGILRLGRLGQHFPASATAGEAGSEASEAAAGAQAGACLTELNAAAAEAVAEALDPFLINQDSRGKEADTEEVVHQHDHRSEDAEALNQGQRRGGTDEERAASGQSGHKHRPHRSAIGPAETSALAVAHAFGMRGL